jgi:hypothetical protein
VSSKIKVKDPHHTCDLWTLPNSLAILGLVAHFIAENGELRHPVLALKQPKEEHSGENLAHVRLRVVILDEGHPGDCVIHSINPSHI